MDDKGVPGNTPRRDQLTEDASLWFARMRGPDADAFRPGFERWLSADAAHRGAYNRAGEIFALGKFLAETPDVQTIDVRYQEDAGLGWRSFAIAASLVVAIGAGAWFSRDFIAEQFGGSTKMASQPARIAPDFDRVSADPTVKRTLTLADGSTVTLEPGSILGRRFGKELRELRLERGRARFDVAHEARPFIVYAGGGSVTARGTIFEVMLDRRNEVTVRLLRGAVDVARPDRSDRPEAAPAIVTRLAPGETFSFGVVETPALARPGAPLPAAAPPEPSGEVLDFEKTPLSQVVAQANQGSPLAIRLGDPSIGTLQVSGRFRIDDPEQVADRLGTLFNLKVERVGTSEIILRSR